MSEQIFISYRRDGASTEAKLICESLRGKGYTVFYDFDSIHGGYFDARLIRAIEKCTDFILVLPKGGLDRCVDNDDWVRKEIYYALKTRKNVIPIMLPGFVFPNNLPSDIAEVSRYNGVQLVMDYYDIGVVPTIIKRLKSKPSNVCIGERPCQHVAFDVNDCLEFTLDSAQRGYIVRGRTCEDAAIVIPEFHNERPIVGIGDKAFFENSTLVSIELPGGVTNIGYKAFCGCSALASILIPNSVISVEECAFMACDAITNIVIPDSVTAVGNYAFCDCESLESVIISDSVITIGDNAFSLCSSLEYIKFNGTMKQFKSIIAKASLKSIFRDVPADRVHCSDGEVRIRLF